MGIRPSGDGERDNDLQYAAPYPCGYALSGDKNPFGAGAVPFGGLILSTSFLLLAEGRPAADGMPALADVVTLPFMPIPGFLSSCGDRDRARARASSGSSSMASTLSACSSMGSIDDCRPLEAGK